MTIRETHFLSLPNEKKFAVLAPLALTIKPNRNVNLEGHNVERRVAKHLVYYRFLRMLLACRGRRSTSYYCTISHKCYIAVTGSPRILLTVT